jgi:DNA-directed RNA polymerase subunit RPC12/RpoP
MGRLWDLWLRKQGTRQTVWRPDITDEHRRYYTSGFRCPRCEARLVKPGWDTAKYLAADGRKLNWLVTHLAHALECPNCGYRWIIKPSPRTTEVLDIVETGRSEELIGEDRRVIDNSGSSTQVKRNFTISREWSKSFSLDLERATSDGSEMTIGSKDAAVLKLSSEERLRRTYSVSQGAKETVTEEVSCQVPPRTMTTVVVRWKRIWQHGLVHILQGGVKLHIPFRVAVDLTFDQQQIDGEHTRSKA